MHSLSQVLAHTAGLCFPLGETDTGEIVCADLADISHLLVAGASGTGKSVFINSLLLSLISNNGPENLRLVLCDTKMVELSVFNRVSNLLIPVCTDAMKIHGALRWIAHETENRLRAFSAAGKKNLSSYNDYTWEEFVSENGLPQIVVVVDDFASALLEHPEMADSIRTILLNGRTAGVHLIFSTQTPTWKAVKSISTLFRSKILFPVASKAESTALIGNTAAFGLSGCGDAIYSNGRSLTHMKSFIADFETSSNIIEKAKVPEPHYSEDTIRTIEENIVGEIDAHAQDTVDGTGYDELLPAAIEVVLDVGQASVSTLQRRLKLGYGRAARLVDQMEEMGVVGPFEGSKPRLLLITKKQWQEMQGARALSGDTEEIESKTDSFAESYDDEPECPDELDCSTDDPSEEAENFVIDSEEIISTDYEVPYGKTKHGKGYKHRILDFLFGR